MVDQPPREVGAGIVGVQLHGARRVGQRAVQLLDHEARPGPRDQELHALGIDLDGAAEVRDRRGALPSGRQRPRAW